MDHVPKYALPVRINLAGDQDRIQGVVYARQDQRVVDMLCDARAFFPIRTNEGLVLVNKAAVTTVILLGRETVERDPDLFPDVNLAVLARRTD